MAVFPTSDILKRCAPYLGAALLFVWGLGVVAPTASAATITPRVEIVGDPGQTVSDKMKLVNEERQSKTFYITFENFESQDETGNPKFSPRREDLAAWLEAPATVTVGPGAAVDVPFSIHIPSDAEPGGHYAAIFFQTEPPDSGGGEVAVTSKLGSLILLSVSGDFPQGAAVLQFGTKNRQRIFNSLPVTFYYRFQNTGADHLRPVGDVLISNTIGRLSKILRANPVDGSVLSRSIRRFETTWSRGGEPLQEPHDAPLPVVPEGFWNNVKYQWSNFAFGKYTATLKVVYGKPVLESANAKYTFFVVPWQLLLVVVVVLVVVLGIGPLALLRYKRKILAQAGVQQRRKTKR